MPPDVCSRFDATQAERFRANRATPTRGARGAVGIWKTRQRNLASYEPTVGTFDVSGEAFGSTHASNDLGHRSDRDSLAMAYSHHIFLPVACSKSSDHIYEHVF